MQGGQRQSLKQASSVKNFNNNKDHRSSSPSKKPRDDELDENERQMMVKNELKAQEQKF